ncbi:invasion associated locus B family protein [Zavarzinia compransoris]|nr:invasion associated locus B family protein [Zavarzinia compransoris]TDP43856.1 invasion protein IalB [Zavarzinia compransoris]
MFARLLFARLLFASLLFAAPALAEETKPDAETSTFGTWTMRCIAPAREDLPPCDILQTVTNRDNGQTIMQASFAYSPPQDKYAVQLVLPLGFLIPAGVLVRVEGGKDITDWPVTRCEAVGCLVERLLTAADFQEFRSHDKGMVVVLDPQGKPLALPLEFKGFAAALDAMTARNKAAHKPK